MKMYTKRTSAKKMWIKDVFSNQGIKLVRVLGTVVSKFYSDKVSYSTLTLDDNTDTIRLKFWDKEKEIVNKINIGEIIEVIARVNIYNNEIYLVPEIINKISDLNKMLLWKLELSIKDNHTPIEEPKLKILKVIKENDNGQGVSLNVIKNITKLNEEEIKQIISELALNGEIFEPSPGIWKLL